MKSVREFLSSVDIDNLASLISAVDHISEANISFKHLVKISFLRNFTIEGIEPYLKYHLFLSGIEPSFFWGNYNTIHQEVLDAHSHLYHNKPDLIILSLMLENMDLECHNPDWSAEKIKNELLGLFDLVASKNSALIAVNTFISPFYSELGISSFSSVLNLTNEIASLNKSIKNYVHEHSSQFFIIDWERFIRILGQEKSIDYRYWYMAKVPFKKDFLNLYALELTKIVKALKGLNKKCLVLDCDNTLWGGVIGEDELQGIKLDRNEYPGKVFYEFQKSVLHLVRRGALVALCSKNNEEDVMNVLDNHPHCLLKRSHLVSWRINWDNKIDNLISLADELNVGIDSFVFIDDDSSECQMVQHYLPEVTVLQVPQKLYLYPQLLFKEAFFDTLHISAEDKKRTAMYQAEIKRKQTLKHVDNLDDWLKSLELIAAIHPIKKDEIARVAQLTQKTNQFNLTTRRYSEQDIRLYCENPSWKIYTLAVKDKFGDYGLTGVLIIKTEDKKGIIDTFLMSCRILGKRLEDVFLNYAINQLEAKKNIIQWSAGYIPAKKNQQVENFWDDIGFTYMNTENGTKIYSLKKGGLKTKEITFVKIIGD